MKKSTVKKSSKKTSKKPAVPAANNKPLVGKQPQSKQKAAIQAAMFLHTDDAWAAAYFSDSDLHFAERELFG